MNLTIRRNAALYVILIIMFPVCQSIGSGIFQYYDEIIGVVAFLYTIYLFISKRLEKTERIIVILLVVITIIGLLSNAVNMLVQNIFAILVDGLWLYKTFCCYIMFKYISSQSDVRDGIVEFLAPLAKLVILFVALLAVINIFADIGVSSRGTIVMGFRQYTFLWGNTIQTGWLLFCCLCLIAAFDSFRTYKRYLFIACIPAVFTFSSLVYCWFFIAVLMTIFWGENSAVKIWQIIVMVVGVLLLTFADVQAYILSESVRATFWKAAIQLANRYFPLGTGFASFGSDMAARYYSSVYVDLGWESTWALGRNGGFLDDNFFASIIGQFGWIGFILYLATLGQMFIRANFYTRSKSERTVCISTVLTICAVMIGSASAKSLMGCCMFAVLGIVMGYPDEDYEINEGMEK
ncbi:MAG: hypothetical protein LUI06_01280 [Ruminococcus sp.]|nr:hypothetical protein [Ruminococcus sp.]